MLLAESTRLLSVKSIYTLREYAILTTSQTSKTILRCRRRQTYSCVLWTFHQERYFGSVLVLPKTAQTKYKSVDDSTSFNSTNGTWMPKRSNVCLSIVWNMCLIVRLTLNSRCRISIRNENGDIQVFQKLDCAYFHRIIWTIILKAVEKSLQIFLVYHLCLNRSAEAEVSWVKCRYRLGQLRTDLHPFPSCLWVRIYCKKSMKKYTCWYTYIRQ